MRIKTRNKSHQQQTNHPFKNALLGFGSIRREALLFSVFTALSIAAAVVLNYQPRVRFNFEVSMMALLCSACTILSRMFLDNERQRSLNLDNMMVAALRCGGEEVFLRAFVFGYLSSFSTNSILWTLSAYLLSAFLSFGIYFLQTRACLYSLSRASEAIIQAFFFDLYRSTALIALARLLSEVGFVQIRCSGVTFSLAHNFRKFRRS